MLSPISKIITAIAVISLSSAVYAQSSSSTAAIASAPKTGEGSIRQLVSLDLKSSPLPDTIEILSSKYHLNIVSDAFADDVSPDIHISDMPLKDAIVRISTLYGREAHSINGVLVFRHHFWFMAGDKEGFTKGFDTWTQKGSVSVEYPQIANKTSQPKLSVKASIAPLHQILQQFADATEWDVSVGSLRRSKRFSASLNNATPGQFIEAISFLLNARQHVFIDQTVDQRKAEKLLTASTLDQRDEREKKSEVLRNELLPLLTADQRSLIANGQELALQVSSLPPNLQKDIYTYINFTSDRLQNNTQIMADRSRMQEFSIVFLPPANAPGGALGINGYSTNGGKIEY